jgi:hypothetical protein
MLRGQIFKSLTTIKGMDLREIGFEDVNWLNLSQDRDKWQALVNTVVNIWVP